MVEQGSTQEQANRKIGVSSATITRWRDSGRSGRSVEARAFAQRLDAVTDATTDAPLRLPDLIRIMERQARKGSVTATKFLIERLDRLEREQPPQGPTFAEQIAAIRERGRSRPGGEA